MKDDLDFAEIDKAINESMAQQKSAPKTAPRKSVAKPAPSKPTTKSATKKPTPPPASQIRPDVARPSAPSPKTSKPRGHFMDIIPPKKPLPTVQIATTEITYYEETVAAPAPTPATPQSQPEPISSVPIYPPRVEQPRRPDVQKTSNLEEVLTEDIFTSTDDDIRFASPEELRAQDDFLSTPTPLDDIPQTLPLYRPVSDKFVNNLKVEKRPLSKDVPEDHESNIQSTQNTYSKRSVMTETVSETRKGRKDRKEKVKREKPVREQKVKVPKEKKEGLGFSFFLILAAIIILGAAAGFLLYVLLAN